ncbi:uncharacterized protein LOC134275469, partial [Saccostrea cucullata]|uniref:uncharacterized protein LOC134275469 n=1 Tax=Saccostrea cuccullata TaxID=36930 RepID=UPI002ED4B65F
MKNFLVFVFTLTVLWQNFHVSLADWQHPHYSYRCLENRGVEFFGMHSISGMEVEGKPCSTTRGKHNVLYYFIPYTCMNETDDGHTATITVYDREFDGTNIPTPTVKSFTTYSPSIFQGGLGLHKFVIMCHNIRDRGINKTVAHVFQEKDFNELSKSYKEVGSVEMRFKAVNDSAAPDINTVYTGDEFYMFIKYMGEQDYSVIPEKCTAFGEAWTSKELQTDQKNSMELWNIHKYTYIDQSCATHVDLLEGFYRYNKTLIYAKMFGFRFARKDKGFITIACQVKIYNSITSSGNKNLCMRTPTVRKKRHIENAPFQTRTLTKKLQVFDNKGVHEMTARESN